MFESLLVFGCSWCLWAVMCVLGHLVDVFWYSPLLIRRDFLKVSYFVLTFVCFCPPGLHKQSWLAVFPQTLSFHFTHTHTLSLHIGWQRLQHWKVLITVLISLQRINWFYCCADGTFGVISFFNLFKMSQDGGECIYFTAVTPVGKGCQLWLAQYLLNYIHMDDM